MAQLEGEKEIVMGNKQLISLFFVVVALLGVFFAAGYLIGQKSGAPKDATKEVAAAVPSESTETRQDPATRVYPGTQTREATPTPVETAPPVSAEKPRREPVETPKAVPPPVVADPPVNRPPPAYRSDKKTAEVNVGKQDAESKYLQVTALRRPDADNLVRSLREKDFPAMLAESSKEGLFRVLVGPYRETAKVAEAKNRLKALGFAEAIVISNAKK